LKLNVVHARSVDIFNLDVAASFVVIGMEWKQEGMAETVLKELAVGPDSRAKNDYFRQTVHQQDVVRELVKGGVSSHIGFVGCIIYETHTIQKLPNAQKSSRSRCRMLPFTTDSNILALA
jgi:hypothetical protein